MWVSLQAGVPLLPCRLECMQAPVYMCLPGPMGAPHRTKVSLGERCWCWGLGCVQEIAGARNQRRGVRVHEHERERLLPSPSPSLPTSLAFPGPWGFCVPAPAAMKSFIGGGSAPHPPPRVGISRFLSVPSIFRGLLVLALIYRGNGERGWVITHPPAFPGL